MSKYKFNKGDVLKISIDGAEQIVWVVEVSTSSILFENQDTRVRFRISKESFDPESKIIGPKCTVVRRVFTQMNLPTHVEEIFTEMGKARAEYLKSHGSLFEEVLTSTPQRMPQPPISDYFFNRYVSGSEFGPIAKPLPMNMVDTVKELLEGYLRNGTDKERVFAEFMIRQVELYETSSESHKGFMHSYAAKREEGRVKALMGKRVTVTAQVSQFFNWSGVVWDVIPLNMIQVRFDNGDVHYIYEHHVRFID